MPQSFMVDDQATLLFRQGYELWNQDQHAQSLAAYTKAVQLKPDYVDAWYYLGYSLEKLGRYEQALANYDQVIRLAPNHPYAWYRRGGLLLTKIHRYDQAVAAYKNFIQIQPTDYEGWYFLGDALLKLEQYSEAVNSYCQAVLINITNYWDWCERVNNLQQLQQQPEAIRLCEAIAMGVGNRVATTDISDYERDALHECLYVLADCFLGLESYEQAVIICNKALQSKPNERLFWYSLGKAQELLQRYDEAIKSYEQAIEIEPNFLEASKGLEQVLLSQKEIGE